MGESPYDKLYAQIDMVNRPFGYSTEYMWWRVEQVKKELTKHVVTDDKLLDVGGGMGLLTAFLPRWFDVKRNYFNLDVSSEMLSYSEYNNILASSEQIPRLDGEFAYVVCSEVLEHVADKVQTLRECHRVLKRNGLLLLSTPRTGWRRDYVKSLFLPLLLLDKIVLKIKPRRSSLTVPVGVKDEPSDEAWLRETIRGLGLEILDQHRADNHAPWSYGEGRFWRWFSDHLINPRKYGHCTIIIARKT